MTAETKRRLHVVIVDEELPYPPITGKRLRTFKLLIRLARRHRLTYICHRNQDANEARLASMLFADHRIETIAVDRAVPSKSGPAFYARLAANLLSPLPYSVTSHQSDSLRRAIQEYAARHKVDVWHCEWTPYAQALAGMKGIRRLVMAHNVESVIWQRYYETERNPVKRWYIKQQWLKFREFEQRVFKEADQIIAVSQYDARLIQTDFGGRQVGVVDNGVDTAYFRPLRLHRDRQRVLFLGSLEWRPNIDAVHQLLERIFPAVRAQEPQSRLIIVGRNPPDWLRRKLLQVPNAELHANVTDVRPHIARAGVMAVPLRIGGGSRLKILEALAMAVSVVSTRVGAEGLELEHGRHLHIVDNIDEMGPALVDVIRHHKAAQATAERGRLAVLDRYDWKKLALQLERIWLHCASGEASAPNHSFTEPAMVNS